MNDKNEAGGPQGFGLVFTRNEKEMPEPESQPGAEEKKWTVGALRPKHVDNRSPEFLTQVAKDIATNLVFTHLQIRDFDKSHISMIFMPIAMGCFADCTKEYIDDIGLIYEYYDKAGPRGVNGYPCFFSMQILSKHDVLIPTAEECDKLLAEDNKKRKPPKTACDPKHQVMSCVHFGQK